MRSLKITVGTTIGIIFLGILFAITFAEENQPPVAKFSFFPPNPRVGEEVTFDASASSDPDGVVEHYEWDFDNDGVIDSSGPLVNYKFDQSGEYEVTLVVIDNGGLSDSLSHTVTIQGSIGAGKNILSFGLGPVFLRGPWFLHGSIGFIIGKHTLSLNTLGYFRSLIGQPKAIWVIGSSLVFNREAWERSVIDHQLRYNRNSLFTKNRFMGAAFYQRTSTGSESADGEEHYYTINSVGEEAFIGYPLGGNNQLTLSQRYERFHKCFREMGECEAPGTTSSVTIGLTNDDRNSDVFPTEGGIRSISLEQAGAFTSGTRFTKLTFTLAQHFPTSKDQNIALRLHGGLGFSLPSQERFRLGGVNTIRGIPTFGTNKFVLLNAEYQARLVGEDIAGALFIDLGFGEDMVLQKSFGLEFKMVIPYVSQARLILSWPFIEGEVDGWPKLDFGFGYTF